MELPKDFDSRHWWILAGVAGALVTAASAPVQFIPGFVIGLALLLFGIGQWIDHPLQMQMGHGFTTTRYPWSPTVFGTLLSILAAILFCFGLWRLWLI